MEETLVVRLRRSAFALPLAVIAALVVVVINETGYGESTAALRTLVERNAAVIQVQTVLRGMVDAETGQRGYLLTGRARFLEPYERAVRVVTEQLAGLHESFDKQPATHVQVQAIETAVQAKFSELAATIGLFQQGKHEQWQQLLLSEIGREKMEELRTALLTLRDGERERIEVQVQSMNRQLWIGRVGVNLMAAAALVALLLFLRNTRELDRMQLGHAQALRAERDQLEGEVTSRTAELNELTQHLETTREDERGRLARELHDELGALLTAAKLDVARLKRSCAPMSSPLADGLKHLSATLDQGIALKRNIIEDLRPSSLSNLGLVAALSIQAKEFAKRSELKVRVKLEPAALPDSAQITVYRLVQESLTNIAKYAQASEVEVTLADEGPRARITVSDNGIGFDASSTRRSAHGIRGMRHRVESHGGTMRITTSPGRGTTITAWLPALTHPEKTETAPASATAATVAE